MDYTMANKKRDMAAKMPMGLTMHGKNSGKGGGMSYKLTGKESKTGGGMKYDMHGEGAKSAGGMKYSQSNKKANFSNNYTQNGKGK